MAKIFLESIISHVRSEISNKDREIRCTSNVRCSVPTCPVIHFTLPCNGYGSTKSPGTGSEGTFCSRPMLFRLFCPKRFGVTAVRPTICCNLSDAESSPVKAEDLVCIGYRAAVECPQDLLCRLVCGKFHESVALRHCGILISYNLDIHKLSCTCVAEAYHSPGIEKAFWDQMYCPAMKSCLQISAWWRHAAIVGLTEYIRAVRQRV